VGRGGGGFVIGTLGGGRLRIWDLDGVDFCYWGIWIHFLWDEFGSLK